MTETEACVQAIEILRVSESFEDQIINIASALCNCRAAALEEAAKVAQEYLGQYRAQAASSDGSLAVNSWARAAGVGEVVSAIRRLADQHKAADAVGSG